jgi:hypothetical protein
MWFLEETEAMTACSHRQRGGQVWVLGLGFFNFYGIVVSIG